VATNNELLRWGGTIGILLLSGYASAEVSSVNANGFDVKETVHVAAAPDKVFAALLQPSRWWASEHTFSGNAANLTLDARAGGCWCESLPDGGSVEHLHVILVSPGKVIRLRGALGPFQALAVEGVMTWSIKANGNGNGNGSGSDISVSYAISGYSKEGFDNLSKAADQVLAVQIERLRKLIDS
jgi:uncharacterized protein YndB with AHSA1/START domain